MIFLLLLARLWSAQEEGGKTPPEIKPELLLVARVGGANDQWLDAVIVKGGKAVASGERDFKVSVELQGDGGVKGHAWGDLQARQEPRLGLPHIHSATLGSIEYGFNQVDPKLQLPFLKAPTWQLWGWSDAQARKAKAKYAPFLADSQIRLVLPAPDKGILAFGMCDGGNTCLRANPKDINETLDFPIALGGGKGQSSFVFEIGPKGELRRQLIVRGSANGACWDDWKRMLLVGRGIVAGDDSDAHGTFGYGDGGGVLLVDADWQKVLFKATFSVEGKGALSLWAASVDSRSGLVAVVGTVEGSLREKNPLQSKPGTGTDGFIAVFRLWSSGDHEGPK